jgi:hypothetical protein
MKDIKGFKAPEEPATLPLLPLTLRVTTWDTMLSGGGSDNWTWNESTKTVSEGNDSIREVNLFPENTGSSGNAGTLRINAGDNGNGTLARQIEQGLTVEDLNSLGGTLELVDGELAMSGNPGLSDSLRTSLAQVIGKPLVIPLFSEVVDGGSTATFTIVRFVGIRIMEVKLTGNKKRVTIQPANVMVKGVIADTAGTGSSQFVYSVPYLVR